jgi:hypothetical protein
LAAKAGVACMNHADQFSKENMRLMRERQSFAAPTSTISEYFLTDIGALKRVTFVMKNGYLQNASRSSRRVYSKVTAGHFVTCGTAARQGGTGKDQEVGAPEPEGERTEAER